MVDPCIPPAWNGFSVCRHFRSAWYNIQVKNPNHVSKGIGKMTVDGNGVQGNIIPLFTDSATHNIVVIMG
jgi:cellobiose phosphorylase